MVHQRQPQTLYQISHRWFSRYLGDKVVNAGYDNNSNNQTLSAVRSRLRPFFVEHIPGVVRMSLLEETGEFLYQKSLTAGVDCDYGRSVLYLLHLLLSKEVKRLKVILCCYYGCRDMEGVLRCIKKNGASLEHLELSRNSLLRMDPLLFRNVLTSATRLTSLVVRNICSDAMLKLIGSHCYVLQYLDISSSKQVSDVGIEALCCKVQIQDKRDIPAVSENAENTITTTTTTTPMQVIDKQGSSHIPVREDFGDGNGGGPVDIIGCGSGSSWKRSFRRKMQLSCLKGGDEVVFMVKNKLTSMTHFDLSKMFQNNPGDECLVEIKEVWHPICFTLKTLDLTDTSVTSTGLLKMLKKACHLTSLGEYSISDNFLRSMCVVSSMRFEKFNLLSAHTRKITNAGMYNLVHVLPKLNSLTCWEPLFDITDLSYLLRLRELTLLRIPFNETVINQILRLVENAKAAAKLERISLEFIVPDDFINYPHLIHLAGAGGAILPHQNHFEFNIARILDKCQHLKLFSIEFKDSLMTTPPIGYSFPSPSLYRSLVHVHIGQIVLNNAVEFLLIHCPNLVHLHCNSCPDLYDRDLETFALRVACRGLKCFYIYEAPNLTYSAFQVLLDTFPELVRFGNLSRWAVNCEGIQSIVRTIRDNNYDLQILCGSHWFASKCSQTVNLSKYEMK